MRNPYIDADITGSDRPLALLVHGLAGDANSFRYLRDDLERRGYDTVAIELTGHGRADRRPDYCFPYWTEEVLYAVDQLDRTPTLMVGHSMGGLIAAGAAVIAQPERLLLVDPLFTTMSDARKFIGSTLVRFNADHPGLVSRLFRPTWTERDITYSLNARNHWDPHTLTALQNTTGQRILNRFYASTIPARTWLVRPAHSLLVPDRIVPELHNHGVRVLQQRTGSHFPHVDHPEHFVDIFDDMLPTTTKAIA